MLVDIEDELERTGGMISGNRDAGMLNSCNVCTDGGSERVGLLLTRFVCFLRLSALLLSVSSAPAGIMKSPNGFSR